MSLSWFIFVTAVFMALQSFVYKRRGFSRLDYTRSFHTPAVFEGEEAVMVERIRTGSSCPFPASGGIQNESQSELLPAIGYGY